MKESNRFATVRPMILAATAPSGDSNKLNRSSYSNNEIRSSTVYAFRGNPVCKQVFCEVTNLSRNKIQTIAQDIASSSAFVSHSTRRGYNGKGFLSPQSIIVCAFLK